MLVRDLFACVLCRKYGIVGKFLPEKEKEGDNTAGDAGIGKIEYGTEEEEIPATDEGQPGRPVEIKQGELEHVHHPTLEGCAVALTEGNQSCNGILEIGTVPRWREYLAIEDTINDIARGSGQDKADDGEIGPTDIQSDTLEQVPDNEEHGKNAETGKEKLTEEFQAKGHSIVLDEDKMEPWRYLDIFTKIEMCLDIDLDNLVYHDEQQHECRREYGLLLRSGHS